MINIIAKFLCGLQINQEGNQPTNCSWLYSPVEATYKTKQEFDTLSVSIWKNGQQAQSMGQDEILKILMQSKHGVQKIIPSTNYRPCSKLYFHLTFCQFRRNVCSFSRFKCLSLWLPTPNHFSCMQWHASSANELQTSFTNYISRKWIPVLIKSRARFCGCFRKASFMPSHV